MTETDDPLDGLEVPTDRKALRAMLLRAVAADHGVGRGLTVPQLVALACRKGLRPEEERSREIEQRIAEAEA